MVRWTAGTVVALILAAAVLIGLHEDPSSLDEPIEAIFDGIVRVLTLLLGAGGVAVGAYQSGQQRHGSVAAEPPDPIG